MLRGIVSLFLFNYGPQSIELYKQYLMWYYLHFTDKFEIDFTNNFSVDNEDEQLYLVRPLNYIDLYTEDAFCSIG